jgi:hypothetical protein
MANVKNFSGNPWRATVGAAAVAAALQDPAKSWKTAVNAPTIGLYSNNLAVGQGTVLGDLTPCVFTGYAAIVTTPVVLQDANGNNYLGEALPNVFTAGAIGTADIAYGWYMIDTVSGLLVAVQNFDAPYSFNTTGDKLNLAWRWYLTGQDPIAGAGS